MEDSAVAEIMGHLENIEAGPPSVSSQENQRRFSTRFSGASNSVIESKSAQMLGFAVVLERARMVGAPRSYKGCHL